MPNICLTFGTKTPIKRITDALTTVDGLAAWWTNETTGKASQGGTVKFTFGDNGGFDMRVLKSTDQKVHWECVAGPEEWIGTRIEFSVEEKESQNQVMFRHAGWEKESNFFHHCSTKWATFLLSLRDYLESGAGRPYPNDVKIEASGM